MTDPDPAVAAPADPECIHCRQALTPCDCFRGRGCEHNGWMHVRTGEHQCPGMPSKAHPSAASLRALLTGSRQPDERQIRDVAAAAVERVMFAYSGGHARAWIDVHEAADLTVAETLRAAWPLIEAEARAAERQRILAAYWEPSFPRRPRQRTHEWRLLAVLNALTEDSPTTRRFTDADLLDGDGR